MSNTSRIGIEKFNGHNFELWKLKMEYLLVDQEKWITIAPKTKLTGASNEDWEKLDRKYRSIIQVFLADLVLLNVSREDFAKKLWDKLGNLYH